MLDGNAATQNVRPSWGNAARFWERRRIAYNLALSVVALIWIGTTWPHFRHAASASSLLALAVLALLANLAYSAAYLVDMPIQRLARSILSACELPCFSSG